MSGCDYLSLGGFFPESFLLLLIWTLSILILLYLVIKIFRIMSHNTTARSHDRIDSIAILKVRFANGEISQEEFIIMKKLLSQ